MAGSAASWSTLSARTTCAISHHAGVLDNVHRLSTCSEPTQLSSVMFMSPTAESMEDLIREGRQVQSLWEHSRG